MTLLADVNRLRAALASKAVTREAAIAELLANWRLTRTGAKDLLDNGVRVGAEPSP